MKVLIFGGAGFLARHIGNQLKRLGHTVVPVARSENQREAIRSPLCANVLDDQELAKLFRCAPTFGAIIYAVGHCPAGGFDEAVDTPLSQDNCREMFGHYEHLVFGVQNVFHSMHSGFEFNGRFVVIGSAITRLTDEACPPWLYAGSYAAAQAAQAEMVRWLRRDPVTLDKSIMIHRLALGAVDSPFHDGAKRLPPKLLQPEAVGVEVGRLLTVETHEDAVLIA